MWFRADDLLTIFVKFSIVSMPSKKPEDEFRRTARRHTYIVTA
jgi:hypothetical protein